MFAHSDATSLRRPFLPACSDAVHPAFHRERERERGGGRQGERETERGREREGEREGEMEGERGTEGERESCTVSVLSWKGAILAVQSYS